MKLFRHIAFSALLTVGAFSAITYTACTKDACKDVVCKNGGTCSGGTCTCPTGYTGTNCQTLAFIGSWNGSDACTSNTYNNITVKIDPSSTDSTKVLVSNPGGFGGAVVISGTLSTDAKTITLTNQSVGGGRLFSGTITLTTNTTFTSNYVVTPSSGTPDNCTGSYTKQ